MHYNIWTAALVLTLLTATALAAEGDAAQVGDGVYTTLEAAITAAGDGGTVELLKNVTEDVVIPEGADIILDLGQYTLVNESDHTIVNEGTLTIVGNGTVDNVSHGKSAIYNYGTMTIESGTYTRSKEEQCTSSNNYVTTNISYTVVNIGTLTITGGTFSSSVAAYVAEDLCFELDNGNAFTYYADLDEALSHARPGAVISDLTGEDGEDRTYFTVVFDTDGGSPVGPQAVLSGSTAAEPDAPSRAGCRFTSWYLDGQEYDFSAPVTGSITITAGWQEISGSLTVTAPDDWVNPYSDVAAGTWYYDAVSYASANGLMGGVGGSSFDPSGSMNRSMVWTVIARLAGETITGSTWAADARAWAVSQGISDGASPDGSVTREELVTMLYRYTGSPEISVSEQGLIGNYPDGVDVSAWAQNAFAWALSQGVIDGRDGKLAAGESVTRAEAATILARFHLLSRS